MEGIVIALMYGSVFLFLFAGWRYTMKCVYKRKQEEAKKEQKGSQD